MQLAEKPKNATCALSYLIYYNRFTCIWLYPESPEGVSHPGDTFLSSQGRPDQRMSRAISLKRVKKFEVCPAKTGYGQNTRSRDRRLARLAPTLPYTWYSVRILEKLKGRRYAAQRHAEPKAQSRRLKRRKGGRRSRSGKYIRGPTTISRPPKIIILALPSALQCHRNLVVGVLGTAIGIVRVQTWFHRSFQPTKAMHFGVRVLGTVIEYSATKELR